MLELRHHDPFQILGCHRLDGDNCVVRSLLPEASFARIKGCSEPLQRIAEPGLFEWSGCEILAEHFEIEWWDSEGRYFCEIDPYTFLPQISDLDLHLFGEGVHWHIYDKLGAHSHKVDGVPGVLFALWAPDAEGVSVVGDFNDWNPVAHPMRCRGGGGVWELFVPGVACGFHYKFEIKNRYMTHRVLKADPFARSFEKRPGTASVIATESNYRWSDREWMQHRKTWDWRHEPVAIYELHAGSWRRHQRGEFFSYRELAEQLIPYLKDMGFTHIELMPISEHPLDESWGYQCTGYYAPSSRFGHPDDFRFFVDSCHQAGIGVLLDWVAGHFPKDSHGLARFDGSALFEHADPRQGEHRDWGTLIFNYGRHEVRNFLLANALFWLREFHIDGLRVDAVASMLYLDYSKEEGEWLKNEYGGNENIEAIEFLRRLNEKVHEEFPGTLVIAEESTAWPMVSRPTWAGGLGFSMKWNMGWMNDTLGYFSHDPIHRRYHHQELTFAMLYAYHENFVLALSHDEVVHGKRSLLEKMPGDDWQKFANLRLLYTYMYTWPGKKLLFMGAEFAQRSEWSADHQLDWQLLEHASHRGIRTLLTDLNKLYRETTPLHRYDFDACGFSWIDCHDTEQSVLSYLRQDDDGFVVVILNFTPVPRHGYRIGVPQAGRYTELFNSDSLWYGGSNLGNGGQVEAQPIPWMGQPNSMVVTLPPLAGLVFSQ